MKLINRLINFCLVTLFITNLWTLIFNNLLIYFSTLYQPSNSPLLFRPIAFPNPYKLPLYLGLTFSFVFTLWLFYCSFSSLDQLQFKSKSFLIVKIGLLISLIVLFISKLGVYPMQGDFHPYQARIDGSIYYLTVGIYLLFLLVILVETSFLQKILGSKRFFYPLLFVFCTILIAFFTFEAKFPISGHDYSFFFGPIWEISKGKTIFTDIPVQHGFLSILIFSLLFKLGLLNLFYLPALVWIFYIFQYFLCFYLIFKISRSLSLAFTCLFSLITLNYFSISELPISYPQIGPMRWLASIFIIFLFYKLKKINHIYLIIFISLAGLWIIDAGIAILLAYLFTLFILFLTKYLNFKQALTTVAWLFGTFLGILLLINLIQIALGYKLISYLNAFNSLGKYASLGIAQLPIENQTYFWIVMLIYFASIMYFFKTSFSNKYIQTGGEFGRDPVSAQDSKSGNYKTNQEEQYSEIDSGKSKDRSEHLREGRIRQNLSELILLSANLMLFASIYFVGRAHPHNLFNISLLPIFSLFLLLSRLYNRLESGKIKIISLSLVFILFVVLPAFMRKENLTELTLVKLKRLSGNNLFEAELTENLVKRYKKEAELINKNLTEKQVAIFHNDDTYLLYLTNKRNLIDANPQIGIDTKDDLKHALMRFSQVCPKKIAVDCSVFSRCSQAIGINQSGFFPQSIFLKEAENSCNIKYNPIECTNQLCLAKSNP